MPICELMYVQNNTKDFSSNPYILVDESDCHKRIGFRRIGRPLLSVTQVQAAWIQYEQQYQILPVYKAPHLRKKLSRRLIYMASSRIIGMSIVLIILLPRGSSSHRPNPPGRGVHLHAHIHTFQPPSLRHVIG